MDVKRMDILKGLVINPGMVLGKAHIWSAPDEKTPQFDLYINQKEILSRALLRSTKELEETIASSSALYSDAVSVIFQAHKLMANDPLLLEDAVARIAAGDNAYHAYKKAAEKVIAQFQTMTNQYMKNRIVDIEDATDRVLAAIVDTEYEQALTFPEPRILILAKMKPSILYHCQKPSVIGFVSAEGAYDQHSGLIARTFDIPGLIVKEIKEKVQTNDWILLDANKGEIYINPTDEIIKMFQEGKTVKS